MNNLKAAMLLCRVTHTKAKLKFTYVLWVTHGSHNVSRWMTWLPISLKNAAKCDKWYQLQNHLITESLNAKGAWEQLFVSDPQACRIAQCRTKTQLRDYTPMVSLKQSLDLDVNSVSDSDRVGALKNQKWLSQDNRFLMSIEHFCLSSLTLNKANRIKIKK